MAVPASSKQQEPATKLPFTVAAANITHQLCFIVAAADFNPATVLNNNKETFAMITKLKQLACKELQTWTYLDLHIRDICKY